MANNTPPVFPQDDVDGAILKYLPRLFMNQLYKISHCYTELLTTLQHSVHYRSLYAAALLHQHLGQRHLRLRELLEGLQAALGRGH